MCGIGGLVLRQERERHQLNSWLDEINLRQKHRGPDGQGTWSNNNGRVGLSHVRLSIIDLSDSAAQPMQLESENVISYNGEIYNYLELRKEIGEELFRTHSDTEVVLRAYEKWGEGCVEHLRGMFAFAIWDARKQVVFVARDRFGIKPFYYCETEHGIAFASEIKALLPFMPNIESSAYGLRDYFCFQFCLGKKTMFESVFELAAAHCGTIDLQGNIRLHKYWEVYFDLDWNHTDKYFVEQVRELLRDSVRVHLRADVEVGSYISGGIDSSLVASLARELRPSGRFLGFNGRFEGAAFDESHYAQALADKHDMQLLLTDISEGDFVDNIANVIYHLDQPVAGPGSFPQYMVSRSVKDELKVVLGGQGGDEIFGGYARYLLAYFEQCLKGALDGTSNNGNFVVTYESIIPNLTTLQQYKPLMQEFWADGIFDERDKRYFRLVNRSNKFGDTIRWEALGGKDNFEDFREIYWGGNVGKESYFDSMTHFDFKTLLPALLQVEDRMSMAHGIESRVPLLDHPLVEMAATIPSSVKFKNGELKRLLKIAFADRLPDEILQRKDKMGFPVPLQGWMNRPGMTRDFVLDTFKSSSAKERDYLVPGFDIEALIARESTYGRNIWAFLSLELWHQKMHDGQQQNLLAGK